MGEDSVQWVENVEAMVEASPEEGRCTRRQFESGRACSLSACLRTESRLSQLSSKGRSRSMVDSRRRSSRESNLRSSSSLSGPNDSGTVVAERGPGRGADQDQTAQAV